MILGKERRKIKKRGFKIIKKNKKDTKETKRFKKS